MGSRTSPNHGGSGFSHSRITRPKNWTKKHFKSDPIKTSEELSLYLSGSKIACLICGEEFKSLGQHLSFSHSLSSKQYKEIYNIPATRSLCCQDLIDKKREITSRIWEENPKMEIVRRTLKKNISNLCGTRHKSKSSIPRDVSKSSVKKAKSAQLAAHYEKYRPIYLGIIEQAIKKACTIYEIHKNTHKIYKFARNHPEDIEFSYRLNMVVKPSQKKSGYGKIKKICPSCGLEFLTRHDRPTKKCNKNCVGEK